jgi:hypothetical protein
MARKQLVQNFIVINLAFAFGMGYDSKIVSCHQRGHIIL